MILIKSFWLQFVVLTPKFWDGCKQVQGLLLSENSLTSLADLAVTILNLKLLNHSISDKLMLSIPIPFHQDTVASFAHSLILWTLRRRKAFDDSTTPNLNWVGFAYWFFCSYNLALGFECTRKGTLRCSEDQSVY